MASASTGHSASLRSQLCDPQHSSLIPGPTWDTQKHKTVHAIKGHHPSTSQFLLPWAVITPNPTPTLTQRHLEARSWLLPTPIQKSLKAERSCHGAVQSRPLISRAPRGAQGPPVTPPGGRKPSASLSAPNAHLKIGPSAQSLQSVCSPLHRVQLTAAGWQSDRASQKK